MARAHHLLLLLLLLPSLLADDEVDADAERTDALRRSALEKLERAGTLARHVTLNVDGLHVRAGQSLWHRREAAGEAGNVVELHGALREVEAARNQTRCLRDALRGLRGGSRRRRGARCGYSEANRTHLRPRGRDVDIPRPTERASDRGGATWIFRGQPNAPPTAGARRGYSEGNRTRLRDRGLA